MKGLKLNLSSLGRDTFIASSLLIAMVAGEHMEDYWNERVYEDTDYIPIPKGSLGDRGDPLFYIDGFIRSATDGNEDNPEPFISVVANLHSRNAYMNQVYQSYM